MLNGRLFDKMAGNATFINTGRGAQVVEKDLIKALKEVPTRTAVLDVTYPEPPKPGSELYKMDNVILTSHIAGSMNKEIERMGCFVADEFIRYIKGEDLKYEVTLKMLKTMA
jgi:phosphoglycerate dehydrogenase-like enzyme